MHKVYAMIVREQKKKSERPFKKSQIFIHIDTCKTAGLKWFSVKIKINFSFRKCLVDTSINIPFFSDG